MKFSNKASPWRSARLAEKDREKYLLIQTVGWALRQGCCEATGISEGSKMVINACFKSNYTNYVFNLISAKFETLRKCK